MVLKKRSGAVTTDGGSSKKKRKEEALEGVEIPSSRKSKKKVEVKVEEVNLSDEELPDDHELDKDPGEVLDWPLKDMLELFQRIEAQLPESDNLAFATRSARMDWEEIAFNSYSPNECKQVWEQVSKKVRRFRVLKELVADARQWVQKPWTNFYGGQKHQNHPDMPRRPLSQYMLYYMEKKDKVAEQNPQLQMTDVSKLIAEMYKRLSNSKKLKYVSKAAELREEYDEKMRQFYLKHPEMREERVTKKSSRSMAASKDPVVGCPKPRPPRNIYLDEMLKKHENSSGFDKETVVNEARLEWKDLSEKKRLFYIKLALEEEKKFQEAIKQYCEENPNYEPPPFQTVLKKDEVALKERAAGKPRKPPSSGYSLYSRIMLAECPELRELPPSCRMKEISVRWGQMTDPEKNEYNKRVKFDRERYKLEYATYLESLTEDEKQEELMKSQSKFRIAKPAPVAPVVIEKSNSKAKPTNTKSKANSKSNEKVSQSSVPDRSYFPGEPRQPPVRAYDLFVQSFKNDTKLSESEAPRFWEMLHRSDKAKFERKLKELKDQYIKDYEKFLKSLDQEQLSKYNELQRRNKANADKKQPAASDEEDEADTSDEQIDSNDVENDQDSDSDEDEAKKSDSSSDSESSSSSSSNSSSSSSSGDSDSSSDDSDDDDDDKSKSNSARKDSSDSDSSG